MTGWMEVCTRTEKTVSHALRSPFTDRPVKITNKLSKDEKEYWILVTHEAYKYDSNSVSHR